MKDPAFLFYTNDFLSGVSDLTFEERGQYITLLCLQHQKGRLTKKMIDLCCGNATADVMSKFSQDGDGLFYNKRLEIEIHKRAEHSEKQRQRALEGWKNRKNKDTTVQATVDATALPLVNENENVNEDINKSEDKAFNFKKSLIEIGIEKEIVETFLQVRNKKKLVNSKLAFNKIKSEIDKSKLTPNEAIKIAAEKSWGGFEAEWVNKQQTNQQPQQQVPQPIYPKF